MAAQGFEVTLASGGRPAATVNTQGCGLVQNCHAKIARSLGDGFVRQGYGAMPVAVRLDDGAEDCPGL